MEKIVVFVTAGSRQEAARIAEDLVGAGLAACVNIVPEIESVFNWKGKVEAAKEALLIAKTKKGLFRRLEKAVKRLHSYECPEVIALEISEGSRDYLKWLESACRPLSARRRNRRGG